MSYRKKIKTTNRKRDGKIRKSKLIKIGDCIFPFHHNRQVHNKCIKDKHGYYCPTGVRVEKGKRGGWEDGVFYKPWYYAYCDIESPDTFSSDTSSVISPLLKKQKNKNYELIYIDSKTKTKNINKFIHNRNIIFDYNTIRKSKDIYGIFLADGNEIVGVSSVAQENEDGERFSNIINVFIDERYRGQQLCNMLVEKTFKVLEEKNYNGGVIETVIAGGMPMLKCFLRVVSKLNYNIYSVPTNKLGDVIRNKKKLITSKKALQIEKRNYSFDLWQRLRFEKKIPKKQSKKSKKQKKRLVLIGDSDDSVKSIKIHRKKSIKKPRKKLYPNKNIIITELNNIRKKALTNNQTSKANTYAKAIKSIKQNFKNRDIKSSQDIIGIQGIGTTIRHKIKKILSKLNISSISS